MKEVRSVIFVNQGFCALARLSFSIPCNVSYVLFRTDGIRISSYAGVSNESRSIHANSAYGRSLSLRSRKESP